VAQPGDSIGQPSFLISVKTPGGAGIEPIDSLQILFDAQKSCTTTGLQAIPQTNWSVYPNPAGDYVIVAGDASGLTRAAFRVLDIEGRLVLEGLLHSDTNRIDLSTLKPGVYTLDLPGNVQQRVVRRSF
jgi:hypothetical protein